MSIFEYVGAVEDYWTGIITVVSPMTLIIEDVRAVEDYWTGIITVVSPMTLIVEDVRAALVFRVQQLSFASG